jgi:hypothetical protein
LKLHSGKPIAILAAACAILTLGAGEVGSEESLLRIYEVQSYPARILRGRFLLKCVTVRRRPPPPNPFRETWRVSNLHGREIRKPLGTARPAAIEALTSEDEVCRAGAAFGLSLCGPEAKTAIPPLENAAGDPLDDVRGSAAGAAGRQGGTA